MIILLIKSYFIILLSIGLFSVTIFLLGLYFILKKSTLGESKTNFNKDITAIAGDDIIATQFDLARAYIETGNGSQAKNILKSIVAQGNAEQRQEAKHLLSLL